MLQSMLWFEKYGKPELDSESLSGQRKDKTASIESLHLSLVSKSTRLNLPLDATAVLCCRC